MSISNSSRPFFQACAASVMLARNVDTALAYLTTVRFDMLVSDLAMPGRDGVDLIRTVRASKGPERTASTRSCRSVRPELLAKTLKDFFAKR